MPKVTFKSGGATQDEAEIPVDSDLKDMVRDKNWPILFACEDGVCGTCLIKTAPGESNLGPMDEKEEMTLQAMGMDAKTHRLCCQCKVKGDVTIEQP